MEKTITNIEVVDSAISNSDAQNTLKLKERISLFLELAKVRITFFVAFSTSIGYLLFSGKVDLLLLPISFGVFLLACGASALNHYQESDTDLLMTRTKNRPIPSGKISATTALVYAVILLLTGSALLFIFSSVTALLLGILSFVWYNLIYTPMKKKYVMAVVPGSLIGAIPPVIGWVSAGGELFHSQIIALALFFFIWQIPHFWLLLLIYNEDYIKGGFPTLSKLFSNSQLSRITYIWIAALATSCILIPLFSITSSITVFSILVGLGFWILYKTKAILKMAPGQAVFRKAFINVNIYVLVVVILLSIDKLL